MAVLWVCTLFVFLKVAMGDACASGRFSQSGECCRLCPAGHGVEVECGKENTKCKHCPDGTFSPPDGLSPCLPCARCPAGVAELAPCGGTRDTRCHCGEHFYLWRDAESPAGWCARCSVCERGEGVAIPCGAAGNTRCQPCGPGTFSEDRNDSTPCQPCSPCSGSEVEIRACQPNSDTLCMDKRLHILNRPTGSDGPRVTRWPGPGSVEEDEGEEDGPTPGGARPSRPPPLGGSNNILAYVSVLVAVVLGLLLYVAYKCWMSCKQKKALNKARAAELGTSPEGEKLHSDSGVFLDSHSLQDSQPSKGSKRDSKQDSRLYVNLLPRRQEEVERLLQEGAGGRGGSWRPLGTALGYEPDQMDRFGRGEAPARTLLSNWALQEGSTLGLLCSALAQIDRPDVAAALTAPPQGGSVV